GIGVIIAGSPSEWRKCRQVADDCPGSVDLSGQTTLAQFAALMNRSAINVTNDSGSMHLAAALGRPAVSIFGPTDAVRTGPYGRPETVVKAEVPCAPCFLKKLSKCPFGHACMKQVAPEMVLARLQLMLFADSVSVSA